MADFKETCVEYLDIDKYATFCSSERKWVNKMLRLHETHPSEVQITEHPDDNGGVIVAHIPKTWLKISPPKKVVLTDEQKEAARERLRVARENRNKEEG